MALMYRGRIDGIKKREYQGKARAHLQFVMPSDSGELAFMEIRVPDNMAADRFKIGATAEFPVTYSLVNGDIYFKIDEKANPDDIKVTNAK